MGEAAADRGRTGGLRGGAYQQTGAGPGDRDPRRWAQPYGGTRFRRRSRARHAGRSGRPRLTAQAAVSLGAPLKISCLSTAGSKMLPSWTRAAPPLRTGVPASPSAKTGAEHRPGIAGNRRTRRNCGRSRLWHPQQPRKKQPAGCSQDPSVTRQAAGVRQTPALGAPGSRPTGPEALPVLGDTWAAS